MQSHYAIYLKLRSYFILITFQLEKNLILSIMCPCNMSLYFMLLHFPKAYVHVCMCIDAYEW